MNFRSIFHSAVSLTVLAVVQIPVLAGEWVYPKNFKPGETTTTTSTTTTTTTTSPSASTSSSPSASSSASTLSPPSSTASTPFTRSTQSPTSQSSASSPAVPGAITTTQTNTTTTSMVKQDARLKPFLAAVRANFSAWDRNHDGNLDRQEMQLAAQDFHYTDDAAVALAVLKNSADIVFRSKNELALIKLADMDTIETKVSSGLAIDPDYGRDFERLSTKLKSEPRQLFTGPLPHLIAIHQAATLDCYFLSSVGGLVETNPRAIVEMIKANPDGTYNVTFPGRMPLTVPPPTETEMADYTDAMDGFWLNILEKAYGRTRALNPKDYTAEPLDTAALFRGDCAEVMRLITGHKVKCIQFHSTAANAPTADVVEASVRASLAETFGKHQIVTAAKSHHAYTVTEYNTMKDCVTVHNPYGSNGFERWIDGTKGPRMTHGYFTCSVDDFFKNFRCMWCET